MIKYIFSYPRSAIIASFLLVLPFLILEWVNRREYHEAFPVIVFVILWLLPLLFIITLMPMVRSWQAGNSLLARPATLVLRVVVLALITWAWITTLIDQMPCFMGVPLCD